MSRMVVLLLRVSVAFTMVPAGVHAKGAPLDPLHQWPQWRGPLATGVAPHGNPPVTWSEEKNVRWKVALPGMGHSTPVVWGDRIFVTSALPYGEAAPARSGPAHGAHDNVPALRKHRFLVLAVDRHSGRIVWERTVHSEQPHESTHESSSWASNSPATDGERLYAYFGSRGLYALDLEGEVLWQKDFGDMKIKHGHGEGSSAALHEGSIVVNWDHEDGSFLAALDGRNGKERWKVERDEETSWSTPIVVEHEGRSQVIVGATRRVRSYDLATGKLIWECGGLSGNVVASPVAGDGMVYAGSSYEIRAMLGIRLTDAKGDITDTENVVWKIDRHTPYVPSPLLYGDTLFFLRHYQGVVSAVHAKTGRPVIGPQRLPGIHNVYASLAGAADRVYVVSREGSTAVIRRGPEFEVLAVNQLDDSFSASPAIVGHELILRGIDHLYSIAEDPKEEGQEKADTKPAKGS